ncbi:MAG: divergent polysaccharide deacetylase family protein [Chromatiales bacterium]|nr:divergent polysaccharide deacetylase family protein [Chromatiales bacterium]
MAHINWPAWCNIRVTCRRGRASHRGPWHAKTFVLCALLLSGATSTSAEGDGNKAAPAIAIVIDDVGYRRELGLRALELPGAITFSVLPRSPFGARFAERAHGLGKELLMHQPLSAISGKPMGPGGIETGASQVQVAKILARNLSSVPHAIGVNNHMGSAFTTNTLAVERLVTALSNNHAKLLVVDSRTAANSALYATARAHGLNAVRRDFFLDHEQNEAFVEKQFSRLIAHARRFGTAIGLAHPYPVTLAVLERQLAELPVTLVTLSAIAKRRQAVPYSSVIHAKASNPSPTTPNVQTNHGAEPSTVLPPSEPL